MFEFVGNSPRDLESALSTVYTRFRDGLFPNKYFLEWGINLMANQSYSLRERV